MGTPLVELKNISKAFSGNRVLNGINLIIAPGEILCLAGENGCGKSTMIKIMSGVYTYDGGELWISGNHYSRITPARSIDEGIQVIYQDFSVFPNLTVAENIGMSSNIKDKIPLVNWKRWRKIASKSLEKIGVELDLDAEVGQLSVAQKQIVAISRAISQDAKLIIMDEPTTALTQKEIDKLFTIIRGLKQKGISVVFVSHKLDEIFEVCDRIVVVRSGETVVDLPTEEFPRDKLAYYMTGTEIAEEPFVYEDTGAGPVLEVQGISRAGGFEDVSFAVRPGEILAITGQLGSGRTELALALFGINPIQEGDIFIDGKRTSIRSRRDALNNGIAYLPEDRLTEGLFMNRSLGDNFASVVIDKLKGRFGLVKSAALRELSDRWIDRLHMSAKPFTTPASNFSGGNQQRIVLGKWLAAEPKIFILNGPTVGVDVKSKSEIHAIMKELAKKGLSIIMISDDIGEVLSTSNRVVVMNAHRVVFEGETGVITRRELDEKILATAVYS